MVVSFGFPTYGEQATILNFNPNVAGSLLVLGSICVATVMPLARASGGIRERNMRAGFERTENGLNLTRTSVKNRVIIFEIWEGGFVNEEDGGKEKRWAARGKVGRRLLLTLGYESSGQVILYEQIGRAHV